MGSVKSKSDKFRMIACTHLEQLNDISNAGFPLCRCTKRDLVMSPYNIICQVCVLYRPNSSGITHEEMFVADEAPDFKYDVNDLNLRIEVDMLPTDEDDIFGYDEDEEDEDIDDEDEEEEEEDIEGPIIGKEEEESVEETELEIAEEAEEIMDMDENLEAEDELDELEDELFGDEGYPLDDEEGVFDKDLEGDYGNAEGIGGDLGADDSSGGGKIDFERDVLPKIRSLGDKEQCPYCRKAKPNVISHLPRCPKAPEEVKEALKEWRKKKQGSAKSSKSKKGKSKSSAAQSPVPASGDIEWDSSFNYVENVDDANGAVIYFMSGAQEFIDYVAEKDAQLKRKRNSFKKMVDISKEFKDKTFIPVDLDVLDEIQKILKSGKKNLQKSFYFRYVNK